MHSLTESSELRNDGDTTIIPKSEREKPRHKGAKSSKNRGELGRLPDSDRDARTERRHVTPRTPAAKDRLGAPSDKLTLQKHKTFALKETYIQSDPLLVSARKLVLVPERESSVPRPHRDWAAGSNHAPGWARAVLFLGLRSFQRPPDRP